MGHTTADNLKDIQSELEMIARLEGVKQKSPGIFYLKTTPFLHFHDKDGKRWADVKTVDGGWQSVEINFNPSTKIKTAFVKIAESAHKKLHSKGKSKS